ncbi:hypothetical protein NQ314_009691 [Rhamnusium bicolor]|uniref:BTB domain-containing protein n=1 Tax=Rhamnusium bicolor TaxID=1586634 RepID=A0AAV8XXV8_9CUCU|nr:hypothetical protein NQ314_009691 [Rhamnusium bicolor]
MFNGSGYGDDIEPSPSKSRKKGSPDADDDNRNDSCQIMVDNSDNILRVLRKLYVEKAMCDVYLKVGNKDYGAHRIILCASSDVFQSLSRVCINYMCKHVPHAASHNQLFSWLQYSTYSTSCLHSKVFETCQNYIKWNFESVANTPDFSNFDVDMFIKILQQNDIVVHNEMVLYNCVVRWLELQKIKMYQIRTSNSEVEEEYKLLVERIMKYIRFPMMTPRELADLLLSPLIKQHKEFFVDRMAIGMKYHSGYTDQIQSDYNTEEGKLLFTPRLYTSDSCSAVLTIDNFWSIPTYHTSTFVFSSHLSAAEHESHKVNEWLVDLYPRGVWFRKCFLIVWQGTLEVPQEILSTVRLSLTCRELSETAMRVKVSVLIYGFQGGVEHVMEVREKIHHFAAHDKVMNIDDLIPFNELNTPATQQTEHDTPYLVGPNRDQLKLNLVIAPIR